MKNNMSQVDRIVRAFIAVLFGILVVGRVVSGTLAIILAIVAFVFLFTAVVRFCPLNSL